MGLRKMRLKIERLLFLKQIHLIPSGELVKTGPAENPTVCYKLTTGKRQFLKNICYYFNIKLYCLLATGSCILTCFRRVSGKNWKWRTFLSISLILGLGKMLIMISGVEHLVNITLLFRGAQGENHRSHPTRSSCATKLERLRSCWRRDYLSPEPASHPSLSPRGSEVITGFTVTTSASGLRFLPP